MKIDIISAIRRAESNNTYHAIGKIVNASGKGIALGIWQSLPDTVAWLMGGWDSLKAKNEELYDLAIKAKQAKDVAKFRSTYEKDLTRKYPPYLQDKLQKQYMLKKLSRKDYPDDYLIDYRDLILLNHNGHLKGIRWWRDSQNLYTNLTPTNTNENPDYYENAYRYLSRAGINPFVAGYVTAGEARRYFENYKPGDTLSITIDDSTTVEAVDLGSTSDTFNSVLGYEYEKRKLIRSELSSTGGLTIIGDIELYIPPTAIRIYQQNQIYTVDAIRMAGNAKLLNGAPVTRIDMTVMFSGQKAINEQLRPLIAQFRQTPFTILRNETAFYAFLDILQREELVSEQEIDKVDPFQPIPVVLDSISLNTVPGFPDLIQAQITLDIFNHLPFVPKMRFWRNSADAVTNALYSIYRNTTDVIVEEISPDHSIVVTDRHGKRRAISIPTANDPEKTTLDPRESYVYKKTYGTLLEEAEPFQNAYPSPQKNRMTLYNGDDSLHLKYYSVGVVSLRKQHLEDILRTMKRIISQLLGVVDIASLEGDQYLNRNVEINLFGQYIGQVIQSFNDMYYLFQELRSTAIRLGNLYLNIDEIGPIVNDVIYVLDPYDPARIRQLPAIDAVNSLTERYGKDPAKQKELASVITDIVMKTMSRIEHELPAVKDTHNLEPTQLVLTWQTEAFDETETEEQSPVYYFPQHITGVSMSYRNKLTPVPVHGHELSTYQHLGSGEFSITLNLKTPDEKLIYYLEDIQRSTNAIMRDQIAKKRGFHHVTHRIEITNSGNLLRALGIRHVTMRGMEVNSIDGTPGWFDINLELVQDDISLEEFNRVKLVETINTSTIQELADDLFPDRINIRLFYNYIWNDLIADSVSPESSVSLERRLTGDYRELVEEYIVTDNYQLVKDSDLLYKYIESKGDGLAFYLENETFTETQESYLLPTRVIFYRDNKIQQKLTDYVNKWVITPIQQVYLSFYFIGRQLELNIQQLYDLKSMFDTYVALIADYYLIWSKYNINYHIAQLEIANKPVYEQGESTDINPPLAQSLIKHKRFSLTRSILVKDAFQKIVEYAAKNGAIGLPESYQKAIQELNRIMTSVNETVLDNYPDFAFPFLETDRDHYRMLGPAFPYVDYYNDNVFTEEYLLGENFASLASYLMVALSGRIDWERLKEEKKDFQRFLDQLRVEATQSKLFEPYQIPKWGEVEDSLKVFEELLDPKKQKEKARELSVRLQRTREDVLRLLRVQALLRWYIVSRILSPSGEGFVVDIEFPTDKDGTPSPSDVKVKIKYAGTGEIQSRALSDLISQLMIKDTASRDISQHIESVRKALESGGSDNTEEFLDFIYQAKMDMINLLNIRNPEAYTNLLGFTDADSRVKRRELIKRLTNTKTRTFQDSMYRAFPTIKIFFLDEDNNEWQLFDDFYNYNALISCDVIESKHAASATAVIRLSNLLGKLSDGKWQSMLIDHDTPYQLDNLMLRVGVPIMIKAGYGPDHRNLRMIFYGAVTEIRPGEIVELTAQSWGVELTNPVSTSTEGMNFTFTSAERSMGAAVLKILSSTPGLRHFGRWSPGLVDADSHRISTVDAERAWWLSQLPVADFVGGWLFNALVGDTGDKLRNYVREVASLADNYRSGLVNWGNPLYDNIYLVSAQEDDYYGLQIVTFDLVNIFSTEGQFHWKVYNQNVWDALWEMALFQGDFIVRPLPYNENSLFKSTPPRYTLYFGPRSGYYKFADNQNFAPRNMLQMQPDIVKMLLNKDSADQADNQSPPKAVKALQDYVIQQIKDLNKTADQLFMPSVLEMIFNSRSRQIQKLARILSQLQHQGLRNIAGQLLEILKYQPDIISSGKYLATNMPSVPLIYDLNTLLRIVRDPYVVAKQRYGDLKVLRNIQRYQTFEDFFNSFKDEYDLPPQDEQMVYAFLKLVYNWDQYWLKDIANIVYDLSTANYQEGLYNVSTIRKWMKENSLFSSLFDRTRQAGLDNSHLYRPVVEYHFVNSYQHIIDNQIIATADSMFNKVEVLFPKKPTIYPPNMIEEDDGNKLYRVTAQLNPYLDPNYVRTYQTFQKNLRFDWLVDWLSGKKYGLQKGDQYTARNSMPLFRNVANQILMNMAKPMYQGTLTITGNPNIKPWHIVFLYDAVNQMWGPFEVEQVIHSFNSQSGFTTTITPNAYMTHRNLQEVWDTQYMSTFGAIESAEAWYRGILGGLSAAVTVGILKSIANPIQSFVSEFVSSMAGGVGALTRIAPAAAVLYTTGKAILDIARVKYVGAVARASMLGGWNPITIVPLMYHGKPYLAGLEGAYWGDNVYTYILGQLEENPEYIVQMYPSIIDPKKELMK